MKSSVLAPRAAVPAIVAAAALILALGGCGSPSRIEVPDPAAAPKGLAHFVSWLADLDRLTVLAPGSRAGQFSSHDRRSRLDPETGEYHDWDANGDAGNYLRIDPSTGEAVLAEIEGPGCIWRIWSANPTGRIRFYLDGEARPRLDLDFRGMFRGEGFPFPRPLLWQRGLDEGGDNRAAISYVPIPFSRSCRVTADRAHDQYYHVGFTRFPDDWNVESFRLPLGPGERAAVDRVARALSECGEDPGPTSPWTRLARGSARVPPGGTAVLASLRDGPGKIRGLRARLGSGERWAGRKVVLRMYWDGEDEPSVEAPFADFFGDPWQGTPYRSLPLGITEEWSYCYFRMPFASSARIVVANEGAEEASLAWEVVHERTWLPPGAARFHARWRRDAAGGEFDYELLDAKGAGRIVGIALYPDNLVGGWWGEGDEKVWVDGEPFPSFFGTGSEDYFGDAWGIRRFDNPFHGCPTPVGREAARRQACYRWHIADDVPFERSVRMTIENYSALSPGPIRNDYSSMAYWYGAPGSRSSFRRYAVEERIPRGPVIARGVEVETALRAGESTGVRTVPDGELPVELSGGRGVVLSRDGAAALSVDAPGRGDYSIEILGPGGDPVEGLQVSVAGTPFGHRVPLRAGPNAVEVRRPGAGDRDGDAILDCFLLHPWRSFVREWYLIGPFPNREDRGLDEPFPPEVEAFRADARYPGKGGEVGWRRIVAASGIVEGLRRFDDPEDLVAYACCEIISPTDRAATALLGSDDGVKVWVNGELVHANHRHRVVVPDEDRFEIRLRQGPNRVLLKVDQGGGPWGFALRVEDPGGELTYGLPSTGR